MFHRKVIIKLKFFRDVSSQCYYMVRKKNYVLSYCGSTLSLVYISSSIVLNLLSYLGPIKKHQNTFCSASPKLCLSVVSNFSADDCLKSRGKLKKCLGENLE